MFKLLPAFFFGAVLFANLQPHYVEARSPEIIRVEYHIDWSDADDIGLVRLTQRDVERALQ